MNFSQLLGYGITNETVALTFQLLKKTRVRSQTDCSCLALQACHSFFLEKVSSRATPRVQLLMKTLRPGEVTLPADSQKILTKIDRETQ